MIYRGTDDGRVKAISQILYRQYHIWDRFGIYTNVRKNCSSDRENFLKFKAEGREFAKILRSLEQFIQTVKGQNNLW
jgi:hypothetical protein